MYRRVSNTGPKLHTVIDKQMANFEKSFSNILGRFWLVHFGQGCRNTYSKCREGCLPLFSF